MSSKKLFFFELNEFNKELLHKAASEFNLKSLKRLTKMKATPAYSPDTYESDYLEPWVQWVSVHTGQPSSVHNIKHLGDVPLLKHKQLWEQLSDYGVSSGLWGPMNAVKGDAKLCHFFLPDPWTFSESASPQELNDTLGLARYMAQNYLHFSPLRFSKEFFRFVKSFSKPHYVSKGLKELPVFLKALARHGPKAFVAFNFVEYLSALQFLDYYKKYKPDFALLFVNGIAHVQHYYWQNAQKLSKDSPIFYGFYFIDKILEALFEQLDEDCAFVAFNGLSQKNTNEEAPWNLYKIIHPNHFFSISGCRFKKVEPLMTYDGHVFFENAKERREGAALLKAMKVRGEPLFLIEDYGPESTHLFYRVQFYDPLPPGSLIENPLGTAQELDFYKYFKQIVVRTGKHIPVATLYSNQNLFPERLANHEVAHYLGRYFGLERFDSPKLSHQEPG